jgi:MFS family permease
MTGDRWRMLALLSLAELLGMSLWFAGNAAAPELAIRWSLTPGQAGALATSVQLGFVAGTALSALLNLADTLPSRSYFAGAAVAGAAFNAAFLLAPGFEAGLALRFLTGACLAGVYPPAMKMIATWFESRRGLAIGTIVGALTIGKATPYLVQSIPGAGLQPIILAASASALAAAVIVRFAYRDGPYPFPRRPFSLALAGTVLRVREYRLVLAGYGGHMLELYSYWVWIPAFLAASVAGQGVSASTVSMLAFAAIAVGAVGCVWGGQVADRIGHARLVMIAMFISGSCALLTPLAFGGPLLWIALLVLIWGMAVVADSAQFSTLVTQVVPPHAVGTALTLQTSIGFLLTTISIQLVPPLVDIAGWRWAFPMLALGPIFGILAIRALGQTPAGISLGSNQIGTQK